MPQVVVDAHYRTCDAKRGLQRRLARCVTADTVAHCTGHAGASCRWRNVEIVVGGYVPKIVFNTSEPGLVYARDIVRHEPGRFTSDARR